MKDIIPILLAEVYRWGSPLYTCTIDEHMYMAAHNSQGILKEVADCLMVGDVTFDKLNCLAQGGNSVVCVSILTTWPLHETDTGTGLC